MARKTAGVNYVTVYVSLAVNVTSLRSVHVPLDRSMMYDIYCSRTRFLAKKVSPEESLDIDIENQFL